MVQAAGTGLVLIGGSCCCRLIWKMLQLTVRLYLTFTRGVAECGVVIYSIYNVLISRRHVTCP